MRAQFPFRGDPIELRPNHQATPKIVVRDPLGNIIEETHFDVSEGVIVALDNYPAVGQLAIVPAGGTKSLILP